MNAVVRIALTYFQMLPLQRWLNLAGLSLLAIAAAVTVFVSNAGAPKAAFILCTLAVTMILVVPGFGGGVAMRRASRPSIAHLRPHGRGKLLLGSTLAMSLLAVIATLPALAAQWAIAFHDLPPTRQFPPPLELMLYFWPIAVLGWLAMFAASRTLLFAVLFPVIPLLALKLPALFRLYPAFTPVHLVAIGAVAWLVFAVWFLTIRRVQPPAPGTSATAAGGNFAFQWLMDREDARTDYSSDRATLHYLLGSGSYRLFAVTGLWTAAILIATSVITPKPNAEHSRLLLFMLPFLSFQCGVMGFTTARRARLLWLRTGMDRGGLFSVAEKLGLRAAMITWGIVCVLALVVIAASEPPRAPQALVFAAAQGLAAVCMFYVGLALVRNWSASDVALCIGFLLLLLVQMVIANPGSGVARAQPLVTLIVAAALLLPLRWYAQRRWRRLDWRLIQPAKLDWRRS